MYQKVLDRKFWGLRHAGRFDLAEVQTSGCGTFESSTECRCRDEPDRPNRSSCRVACIFSYFSEVANQAHKIEIPLQVPPLPEFAQEPVTLGDHLRRRRRELGLYQKDVAAQIGVTTSTIWNWEHGWTIDLRYIPGVIAFLGYNPIPCPDDTIEKLAWFKQVNGLTLEQLGVEMGRDPEQVGEWLIGRHRPCQSNRKMIEGFLQSQESTENPRAENECKLKRL